MSVNNTSNQINSQEIRPATSAQTLERVIVINSDNYNATKKFKSNYISTTKYSVFSFVPKCLIAQFMRFANIYFLIIAILQCIPIISPLNPITSIAPLIFVLILSMVREGIEDFRRYLEDKKQNSQPVSVLPSEKVLKKVKQITTQNPHEQKQDKFAMIKSEDLRVGQIIKISENEVFPADIILLGTSNKDLSAYIETSSLDGEKNLKKKSCFEKVNLLSHKDMFILDAKIICKQQSKGLYDFDAILMNRSLGLEFGLNEKQLLLKGAKLKNTRWIVGVAAYTGYETKIMPDSQEGMLKQ